MVSDVYVYLGTSPGSSLLCVTSICFRLVSCLDNQLACLSVDPNTTVTQLYPVLSQLGS